VKSVKMGNLGAVGDVCCVGEVDWETNFQLLYKCED